jgi:rRNA processing protein Gar1
LSTGQVCSIVGNQVVIKPTADTPEIGSTVYDGKAAVGVVSDIIGAVDKPYAVVKPNDKAALKVGDVIRLG